jgi:putative endonuclease
MTTAEQRNSLGRYGEALAARLLVDDGMVLLDRNWRCELGEIDLVLRDRDTLVVCEVKTRRSAALGHPLEAVTAAKARRLRRLAARWLADHDVHPREVRLDMVGILQPAGGEAVVEHVRGIG